MNDNNITTPKKGSYAYLEMITKQHEASKTPAPKKKKASGFGTIAKNEPPKMSASEKMLADYSSTGSDMKKNGTNVIESSFGRLFGGK